MRKGKEMYKQRERVRDKVSDKEIVREPRGEKRVIARPVRHTLGSEGCET